MHQHITLIAYIESLSIAANLLETIQKHIVAVSYYNNSMKEAEKYENYRNN